MIYSMIAFLKQMQQRRHAMMNLPALQIDIILHVGMNIIGLNFF